MMGSGEIGNPTENAKASTAQGPLVTQSSYGEWAAAFQTYYGSGGTPPPGYFPPNIQLGPQPNAYLWRGQPIIPPYGTPASYAAIYPPGGIYPPLPPGSHPYHPYGQLPGNPTEPQAANREGAEKSFGRKEKGYDKKSKATLVSTGLVTASTDNDNRTTSGNEGRHSSCESRSEGSSDGRNREGDMQTAINNIHGKGQEASSQQISTLHVISNTSDHLGENPVNHESVRGKPSLMASSTNISAVSDYCNRTSEGTFAVKKGRNKDSSSPLFPSIQGSLLMNPTQNGGQQNFWYQDERELKQQRRKQSNRESARRSRLRKQAECEELAAKVETLTFENMALHTQLNEVTEERNKLASENLRLLEQIEKGEGATTHQTQENSTL